MTKTVTVRILYGPHRGIRELDLDEAAAAVKDQWAVNAWEAYELKDHNAAKAAAAADAAAERWAKGEPLPKPTPKPLPKEPEAEAPKAEPKVEATTATTTRATSTKA